MRHEVQREFVARVRLAGVRHELARLVDMMDRVDQAGEYANTMTLNEIGDGLREAVDAIDELVADALANADASSTLDQSSSRPSQGVGLPQ